MRERGYFSSAQAIAHVQGQFKGGKKSRKYGIYIDLIVIHRWGCNVKLCDVI